MCGIVGCAGEITTIVRNTFREFLDASATRGRDSAGVIKVDKELNYTWVKRTGHPAFLADTREYEKTIETGDSMVLIGHTRHKTSGDISNKNAHPFDFPDHGVCGVHNGTLRAYHKLDTYQYQKVDSEVLYGHLAINGPRETFNQIEGAWCCVWWDDTEKTINFIRNDERPLYFAWSADLKTMFWASEVWMFSVIARKVKLFEGDDTRPAFHPLPVDTLWRFRVEPKPDKDKSQLTLLPAVSIPRKEDRAVNTFQGESEWVETPNGTWIKKEKKEQGGSVKNPFSLDERRERFIRERNERLRKDMDDPVVIPFTPGGRTNNSPGTHPGSTSSGMSNVEFLKNSAASTDSDKTSKSTNGSARKRLSLPGRTTSSSQSSSSDASSSCTDKPYKSSRLNLSGVSHRLLAGIHYITDNVTKQEWTEVSFLANISNKCTFCKGRIEKATEVASILSPTTCLCKKCLTEPKSVNLQ